MSRLRPWHGWLLLACGLAALGFARLRFDVEVLDLLPKDVPAVEGLRLYQRHFANTRELLITVRSPEADQTEAAAKSLAVTLERDPRVHAQVTWQPPWQEHPAEGTEFAAYLWLNQPPAVFKTLAARLDPSTLPSRLTTAREQLAATLAPDVLARTAYDPLGVFDLPAEGASPLPDLAGGQEFFASKDGRFRILFVRMDGNLADYRACVQWFAQVQSVASDWLRAEGPDRSIQLGFTGQPAFMAEIGGGMEREMVSSVLGTLGVIAILFAVAHRRLQPLLWLMVLLAFVVAVTLGLGGLLFGRLNVISVGFAAILLGLAVDYALVLYQEAKLTPQADPATVRRSMAPGILWAAATTAAAFGALAFSSLPGLAQLGSLVALGILLAAGVMLWAYLPPLARRHPLLAPSQPPASALSTSAGATPSDRAQTPAGNSKTTSPALGRMPANRWASRIGWVTTAGAILLIVIVLGGWGLPAVDSSAAALRPAQSPAYATLEAIKQEFGRTTEPYWLVVAGANDHEVGLKLQALSTTLAGGVADGSIAAFTLPTGLWPMPEYQASNAVTARRLLTLRTTLHTEALRAGFTTNAIQGTLRVLEAWDRALAAGLPWVPTNATAQWALQKLAARQTTPPLALGLVYPSNNAAAFARLTDCLPRSGVWLTSWELLGDSVLQRMRGELAVLLLLMSVLTVAALGLAFRRLREVGLSLAALGLAIAGLLALMRLLHWDWNLMNLVALPLLLGMGVDYGIHVQLALRRHDGDAGRARAGVGKAIILCAATTVAGFGSLVWSGNAGLASLGKICATGVALTAFVALVPLPAWWLWFVAPQKTAFPEAPAPDRYTSPGTNGRNLPVEIDLADPQPSRLYCAGVWRAGLHLVRWLPPSACYALGRLAASLYAASNPKRRSVVVDNLLPVFAGQRAPAETAASRLFRNFATKLIDLWRYEAGESVDHLILDRSGWEQLTAAMAQRRGVILLTPHLGNWEFGAPLLARLGVKLLVITQAEPDGALTHLRLESRARWGITTLVIGQDPFAFIEVIRRLEEGELVALLIDRPPLEKAVTVELFGRPIAASVAPAELARATGCVLLPVFLPRLTHGYGAYVLQEITYQRPALRQASARLQLTQAILRAFEPVIRQHPDQWYHFVPVWVEKPGPANDRRSSP